MAISTIGYAALGLVIIYFLAAVLTSHILEVFSSYRDKRALLLERCIKDLIQIDTNQTSPAPSANDEMNGHINVVLLANSVYSHGLISGLLPGTKNPSYVPADNFVMAFLHRLGERANAVNAVVNAGAPALKSMSEQIALLPDDCALKATLQALNKQADDKIETFSNLLKAHYNNVMDRMAGSYKKWSRQVSIGIAFVIAALLNLDSVMIFRAIDTDVHLQEAVQKTSVLIESQRATICTVSPSQPCGANSADNGNTTPPPSTKEVVTSTGTDQAFALFSSVVKPLLDARLPIGWSVPDNNETCGCLVSPFVHIQKVTKPAAPSTATDTTAASSATSGTRDHKVHDIQFVEYKVISWSEAWSETNGKDYVFKFAGWFITALAASLGAPFWFKLFETIVRQTGLKPQNEKPKKAG